MSTAPVPVPAFREALAQFASGVTVVTARRDSSDAAGGGPPGGPNDGRLVGFTATGFTSVSLEPPLVLVCVAKGASTHEDIVAAPRFGISILAEKQAWMAEQFARKGVDRFRNVPLLPNRVPLIDGAVAHLECLRHAVHDAGDHTLLLGAVVATVTRGGRPLVHHARRFGGFAAGASLTLAAIRAAISPGGQP